MSKTRRTPKRLLLLALIATALAGSLVLGDAQEAPAAHEVGSIVDISAGGSHTCLLTDLGFVHSFVAGEGG